MANKILMIDFDNTICATGEWKEGPIDAAPLPKSKEVIVKLISQGYDCQVLTARIDLKAVELWLAHNDFPFMVVTNQKVPARAYIDDRGIRFTNWDDMGRYFL